MHNVTTRKWMLIILTLAILLVATPLFAACGDDDEETPTTTKATEPTKTAEPTSTEPVSTEPVKIGMVAPWTGPSAMVGYFVDWWEKVVEQQVEDRGGILGGRPLEFVNYDCKSTTTGVTAGVTKLVTDENVSAFGITGFSNASMLVGSEACDKYQVLNFTGGVYDLSDFEYTVGSAPRYTEMDGAVIDFVIKVLKPKTVAWLINQSEEDQNIRVPRMKAAFEEAGIEALEVMAVPLDIKDFSPYITRVKHVNPDVLILSVTTSPETLAKQLPELGGWGDTKVVSMSAAATWINTKVIPAAVGWYSVAYYVPGMGEKFPAAREMEEAWSKAHPDKNIVAATSFFYIHLWGAIKAIEMAGTTDREAVAQAARSGNLEFDGPYGHVKINPDGTNTLAMPIVKFLEDGMFEVVEVPD